MKKPICPTFHFLHRISPQSGSAGPNPEEPVDEDEDVKAERLRAATALTTSQADEVGKQVTKWTLRDL